MNQKDLFEIKRMRYERNRKLDIAAERLSRRVVNSEHGTYSPAYMMQDYEAEEVLNKVFDNELIDNKEVLSKYKDILQKSVADSFCQTPENPLDDEEVAFLSLDYGKKTGSSVKIENLFKKSQFSIVNFLKRFAIIGADIVKNISNIGDEEVTSSIFKLICCLIYTIASLIQDSKIDFNEQDCTILLSLLENENGLLGTKKDTFIESLETNGLFSNKEDINKHIEHLISLGCVGTKKDENNESLIYIKEKIIRIKK